MCRTFTYNDVDMATVFERRSANYMIASGGAGDGPWQHAHALCKQKWGSSSNSVFSSILYNFGTGEFHVIRGTLLTIYQNY